MPDPADSPRPLREVIATNPEARRRVQSAYARLLTVVLAAIASLSALLIWHLIRRGRRLRERLGPPRPIHWPDLEPTSETPNNSNPNPKNS